MKALRGSYAAGAGRLPHVEAVARMRARADPDVEIPRSGDRVQFLVTQPQDPRAKVFECTEDPAYARKAGLAPHWLYYLDKQLLPPLRRLFEPFDASVRARIEKAADAARHPPSHPPLTPPHTGLRGAVRKARTTKSKWQPKALEMFDAASGGKHRR